MAQLEYDLVKALWGRTRAVAELVGLRVMRRRGERAPSNDAAPLADSLMEAQGDGRGGDRRSPPSGPHRDPLAAAVAGPPLDEADVSALNAPPPQVTAPAPMGAARRFVATTAVLALAAAGATIAYRRFWPSHAAAALPPPVAIAPVRPTEAELGAQRARAAGVELEKMLAADFGFAQLPAFSAGLARMRAEGVIAAAN